MALEHLENTPLVSIIIPTYDRGYCLRRTIQSVLDQTIANWELILIDNHSTDGTDAIVASYEDRRIKVLKIDNKGVIAESRNKGIQTATGKYLAFLDSDDWWMPYKLEKSIEILEGGADFVYHDLYISPSLWIKSRRINSKQVSMPVFRDLLINGSQIPNSSVVVRRELIEKVGGFSEDKQIVGAEDYEGWLRVAKLTDAFVRLPYCLGYYTADENNFSGACSSIAYTKRLSELYADEIEKECAGVPGWMSYCFASSYYKKKVYDKSKFYANLTIKGRASLHLKARSVVILIFISFYSINNPNI